MIMGSEQLRPWREEGGVIYFSVTSDGTTGEQWITRLKDVNPYAKKVLRSEDFKPTKGVTTEVAVLKGMLWDDASRFTNNIRAEAERRTLQTPNAEVACLIREKFTNKDLEDMGLRWIVVMHKPIKDSGVSPDLLSVSRYGNGRYLCACYNEPDGRWDHDSEFAFAVSQVCS